MLKIRRLIYFCIEPQVVIKFYLLVDVNYSKHKCGSQNLSDIVFSQIRENSGSIYCKNNEKLKPTKNLNMSFLQ